MHLCIYPSVCSSVRPSHPPTHPFKHPYSHPPTHPSSTPPNNPVTYESLQLCIQSEYLYSASSSPCTTQRRSRLQHWCCVEVHTPKRYRQLWVKDLPKVPTWRLEWDSNLRPSGRNGPNLPLSHHAQECIYPSTHPSIHPFIHPSTYESIQLCTNVSTIPPMHPPIHPSIDSSWN